MHLRRYERQIQIEEHPYSLCVHALFLRRAVMEHGLGRCILGSQFWVMSSQTLWLLDIASAPVLLFTHWWSLGLELIMVCIYSWSSGSVNRVNFQLHNLPLPTSLPDTLLCNSWFLWLRAGFQLQKAINRFTFSYALREQLFLSGRS